ncbi:hypothetical protein A176_005955 [Myxococcus hansupus]|uniref:Uncharacterized protein n=1 Tax=Pseudomyxococcus hansupus TaxID=1297742 RepID=A0A0H4X5C3_9BACT|nr:hypothetical protein A176_005955 [Myxococcus hansupus]
MPARRPLEPLRADALARSKRINHLDEWVARRTAVLRLCEGSVHEWTLKAPA